MENVELDELNLAVEDKILIFFSDESKCLFEKNANFSKDLNH